MSSHSGPHTMQMVPRQRPASQTQNFMFPLTSVNESVTRYGTHKSSMHAINVIKMFLIELLATFAVY